MKKHKPRPHYEQLGQEPVVLRFGHMFWSLANMLAKPITAPTSFKQKLTVARPPKDVYAFWQDFTNLARASDVIESVVNTGERKSYWLVNAPFGLQLSWNAEVVDDQTKHRIAWQTVAPADIPHTGEVTFRGIDDGTHTEVSVSIDFRMPLGPVGNVVSMMLGASAQSFIASEIARFKAAVESVAAQGESVAEPAETDTSSLLREARDIDTGGAINHPERIHAADTAVVEETAPDVVVASEPIVAKKHKHPQANPAKSVVPDQRRNLRNQH